jgi:hypothetical protein
MLQVTYPIGTGMDRGSRFEFQSRYIWAVNDRDSVAQELFMPCVGLSFAQRYGEGAKVV